MEQHRGIAVYCLLFTEMTDSWQETDPNERTTQVSKGQSLSQLSAMPEALFSLSVDEEEDESESLEGLKSHLKQGFRSFAESLNDVLLDVTALEVNTMLVEEISGIKFIAEEAYSSIYFCLNPERKIPKNLDNRFWDEINQLEELQDLVEEQRIPPQLRYTREEILSEVNSSSPEAKKEREHGEKYWQLREKLAREYCQIFFNDIYKENPDRSIGLSSKLPFPYDVRETEVIELCYTPVLTQYILKNGKFLRSLRKISELKAAIDKDDKIYAQTVVQLDGDVITRYRKDLFPSEESKGNYFLDRDLLMDVHQKGVTAGEEQWRGLLRFCVNIVREIVFSRRNGIG